MDITSSSPTGAPARARRTGATWMAATGAFLLVAAATVFVAVRWDQIPDLAKLAVVAALTGTCLLAGRALRTQLPATAGVVYHLGAFLIPVDIAAVGIHLGARWPHLVLVEGVVCSALFIVLGRVAGSVVLHRAAAAAAVVAAAGLAAVTSVPAALLLAAGAVAVERAGLLRLGTAWALTAGAGPLLAATALALPHGRLTGVLAELGLAGGAATTSAAATGLLAAWVLGHRAHQAREVGWAFTALAAAVLGAGTTWIHADPGAAATAVVLAGAFLTTETAALLLRRDPFWARPAAHVAAGAEGAAAVAAAVTTLVALAAPLLLTTGGTLAGGDPVWAAACALLAGGWLAADLRRRVDDRTPPGIALLLGGRWAGATVPAVGAVVAAALVGTDSGAVTAAVMVVVAAALVVSGRPLGHPVAATVALWAPVTALGTPWAATAAGLAAGAVLAWAAVLRAGLSGPDSLDRTWAQLMTVGATTAVLVAPLLQGDRVEPALLLVAGALGCWLLGLAVDRGGRDLGHGARAGGLVVLAGAISLDPLGAVLVASVVSLLATVEAIRLREPLVGLGASAGSVVLVVATGLAAGLSTGEIGLALCVTATVAAGLAAVAEGAWRIPFLAAGAAVVPGLLLTAGEPRLLGPALLLTGAVVLGGGLLTARAALGHVGAGIAVVGTWVHLGVSGVGASEAYLAPVALQLVAAGARARAAGQVSSWPAYGPPIALLGGVALAERVAGGGGGHALVAGAVGVAAVAAGGWLRLAAPLLLGTALLVLTTGHEALALTAGVPTWGWLALGGSVLLGGGIALDRTERTPVEATRRLVDTVQEAFD